MTSPARRALAGGRTRPGWTAPGPGNADRDQRREAEQQRPDQVELLLDGQRPEVLDRGGRPLGLQVVDRVAGELPVLEVQRARPDLRGDVGQFGDRFHHPGGQPGDEQDEGRRGHQSPGPPAPEVEQRHRSGLLVPAPQVAGDQVSGDNEEHVHAREPAGQQRRAQVVDDHHGHRDRAQTLNVGPEAAARTGRLLSCVLPGCRVDRGSRGSRQLAHGPRSKRGRVIAAGSPPDSLRCQRSRDGRCYRILWNL